MLVGLVGGLGRWGLCGGGCDLVLCRGPRGVDVSWVAYFFGTAGVLAHPG